MRALIILFCVHILFQISALGQSRQDTLAIKTKSFDYVHSYEKIGDAHTVSTVFNDLTSGEYQSGILYVNQNSLLLDQLCMIEFLNQYSNLQIIWHKKINQKIFGIGSIQNDTGNQAIALFRMDTVGCVVNVFKTIEFEYFMEVTDVLFENDIFYILTNFYDPLSEAEDFAITAVDVNANILWSKKYGHPINIDVAQSMVMLDDFMYVSGTCFPTGAPFGRGLLSKIDSQNGLELNTLYFEMINDQPFSLRVNSALLAVKNNELILCAQAVAGGNDPTDFIITSLDTNTLIPNASLLKAYAGNQRISGIWTDENILYTHGDGNINSGINGFVLSKYDDQLNVLHCKKSDGIYTFSMAIGSNAFKIPNENQILQFAKNGFGEEEMYFYTTDTSALYNACESPFAQPNAIITLDTSLYLISQGNLSTNIHTIASNAYSQSIIQENICLTTKTEIPHEMAWKVYPNPSDDRVFIEGPALDFEVEIFHVSGQKVLQTFQNLHQVSMGDLPMGAYFVRISTQNQRFVLPLIRHSIAH